MKVIQLILFTSLLMFVGCAHKTKFVSPPTPVKNTRMERLVKCVKDMFENDVTPKEASEICERFLNSRR